jgi:hypothetical protein
MNLDDLDRRALGRRAVFCKGWKWLPGMLTMDGIRVVRVDVDPGGYAIGYSTGGYVWALNADDLPAFADPATLGCLLALVREAHGAASVVYLPRDGMIRAWRVVTFAHGAGWLTPARCLGEGATEAEALVAALESAP